MDRDWYAIYSLMPDGLKENCTAEEFAIVIDAVWVDVLPPGTTWEVLEAVVDEKGNDGRVVGIYEWRGNRIPINEDDEVEVVEFEWQETGGRWALPTSDDWCATMSRLEPPPTPTSAPPPADSTVGEVPIPGYPEVYIRNGTSLHDVASSGNPRDVLSVLDQGADIHAKADVWYQSDSFTHPGATALHIAAEFNPDPLVTLVLLDLGAELEAKTDLGDTPLHWAAYDGHPDVVELLLARGADATALNDDGTTPLHYAAWNNVPEVADLLLDWGADATALNDDADTPCDWIEWNSRSSYSGSRLEAVCGLPATVPTPAPTPTLTAELLAVEEYAQTVCEDGSWVGLNDELAAVATVGEYVDGLNEVIRRVEEVAIPDEVAAYHEAALSLIKAVLAFLKEQERSAPLTEDSFDPQDIPNWEELGRGFEEARDSLDGDTYEILRGRCP